MLTVFGHTSIIQSCDSWYELMVGKLLFANPLVTSSDYDLSYCADWSRSLWGEVHTGWQAGTLDSLVDAALRNDFMEVISLCRFAFSPRPFPPYMGLILAPPLCPSHPLQL